MIESKVDADRVTTRSMYFDDVEVTTVLRFGEDGTHLREHTIKSGRRLYAVEGGFPIDITRAKLNARDIEEKTAPREGPRASITCAGVTSWIEDLNSTVAREKGYAHWLPNQNLLFPCSMVPPLRATLEPGQTVLRCRVSE